MFTGEVEAPPSVVGGWGEMSLISVCGVVGRVIGFVPSCVVG